MNINEFYTVTDNRDHIVLVGNTDPVLPILWNKDGEYCIIPKQKIQNVIDINANFSDMYSDKTIKPIVGLWWCDGIPISNAAGRALLSE